MSTETVKSCCSRADRIHAHGAMGHQAHWTTGFSNALACKKFKPHCAFAHGQTTSLCAPDVVDLLLSTQTLKILQNGTLPWQP